MGRQHFSILALLILAAGCRNSEQERNDDEFGRPASRNLGGPTNTWLDGPQPAATDSPSANSWNDPNDSNYDFEQEARIMLAGSVVLPDGRKAQGVFIEVTPEGEAGFGAPIGVTSDDTGHFLIKGLEPRSRYTLTASTRIDGVDYRGQVYARTTEPQSQTIRLTLVEGLTLPPKRQPQPERSRPSSDTPIPPPVMPDDTSELPDPIMPTNALAPATHSSNPHPADGAYTPVQPPRENRTAPPPNHSLAPRRPDLVTNIPNPNRQQSKTVSSHNEFMLIDSTGKPKTFAAGTSRELILLDFMATWCGPCTKAIPILKRLQTDYGSKIQVIGVLCDDESKQARQELAERYSSAHRLNYPIMIEPAAKPGALKDRFEIRGYPTLILLDGTGEVLWRGHPKDEDQLRRVLANQ